jgi:hypothetical protein
METSCSVHLFQATRLLEISSMLWDPRLEFKRELSRKAREEASLRIDVFF